MQKHELLLEWIRQAAAELELIRERQRELVQSATQAETKLTALRALIEAEGGHFDDSISEPDSASLSLADQAHKLIENIQKPVYYKDLAARLLDAGVNIPGTNHNANLLAYLARDKRFHRFSRGTYGLTEWNKKKRRVNAPKTQK